MPSEPEKTVRMQGPKGDIRDVVLSMVEIMAQRGWKECKEKKPKQVKPSREHNHG